MSKAQQDIFYDARSAKLRLEKHFIPLPITRVVVVRGSDGGALNLQEGT